MDPNFWSNGRAQKERLNDRGPYVFVEWSCAYKRNKSVGTLNSGRMVVHIDLAQMLEHGGSISPSSFYGQLPGLLVTRFSSYLPTGSVLLRENEDLESV